VTTVLVVVRRLSAPVFAAVALATAASGSTVDARLLVLQQSDAPPGFRVDRHSTRYWPNAAVVRRDPRSRKLVTRSGRVTGYSVTYEKGAAAIVSTAHLFRDGAGAHVFFSAADAQQRALNAERIRRGGRAFRREPVALGDEASSYRSTTRPRFTLVLWRAGRTVASVSTWSLGRDRTIALARLQQRRVDRALG
jgi:hypothetical protein